MLACKLCFIITPSHHIPTMVIFTVYSSVEMFPTYLGLYNSFE